MRKDGTVTGDTNSTSTLDGQTIKKNELVIVRGARTVSLALVLDIDGPWVSVLYVAGKGVQATSQPLWISKGFLEPYGG